MACSALTGIGSSSVALYWLPLGAGAGGRCVRGSGRAFEALAAAQQRRGRQDLYHSALEVTLDGELFVVEMAPVWQSRARGRGVVCEGAVGLRPLGRLRLFRYEVRCWPGGAIPDVAEAVESPRLLSTDRYRAVRVLQLVPAFPAVTWGRDELRAGEMWNSNSLVAWLLVGSDHDLTSLRPPAQGRAPGWSAGLRVGARLPAWRAPEPAPPAQVLPVQGRPPEQQPLPT
jgi:hypothetical protein